MIVQQLNIQIKLKLKCYKIISGWDVSSTRDRRHVLDGEANGEKQNWISRSADVDEERVAGVGSWYIQAVGEVQKSRADCDIGNVI